MSHKVCSAHQPAFLPWIGTIHKIAISDVFVIMDLAKFRKRSFMHRNQIEINNDPHFVGLQVNSKAEYSLCNEVLISKNNPQCLNKISEKINRTYKNSTYYSDLNDFISFTIDNCQHDDLINIYLLQIKYLCEKLDINSEIILESKILSIEDINDLNVNQRLLEHSVRTNSDIYVTGKNSKNYLDDSIFLKNKVFHLVQDFEYGPFMKIQNSNIPLSIVHQIANIGYKKLKDEIFTNQISKRDIMKQCPW